MTGKAIPGNFFNRVAYALAELVVVELVAPVDAVFAIEDSAARSEQQCVAPPAA